MTTKNKCWLCDKEASAWHEHLCDEHLAAQPSILGTWNLREEEALKADRALRQLDDIKARGPER